MAKNYSGDIYGNPKECDVTGPISTSLIKNTEKGLEELTQADVHQVADPRVTGENNPDGSK